jgi:predicted DNA-binding transcriptional regulator AlpA
MFAKLVKTRQSSPEQHRCSPSVGLPRQNPRAMDENRLLSRKELAAALGVSTRTVDRWIREQTGPPATLLPGRPATLALGRRPSLAPGAP